MAAGEARRRIDLVTSAIGCCPSSVYTVITVPIVLDLTSYSQLLVTAQLQ